MTEPATNIVPDQYKPPSAAVDRAQAEQFARDLFGGLEGFVNARAVKEPRPTGAKPNIRSWWYPIDDALPGAIGDYVEWCGREGYAAFLVPFAVQQGTGDEKGLLSTRAFVVDIDKGDIGAKVEAITASLGEPWLSVQSGGEANGQPKRHLWYRFQEPVGKDDFAALDGVRVAVAAANGGDTTVAKNIGQPIRIPGSLHRKDPAAPKLCRVESRNDGQTYPLTDYASRLGVHSQPEVPSGHPFDLNGYKPAANDIGRVLTQPVLAEGASSDGLTRYDGAGTALGHYIRNMRDPAIMWSEAEARQAARDWNAAILNPAWDDARLMGNFDRLLKIDVARNGTVPPAPEPANKWANFDCWTADRFADAPPKRSYLIEGVLPLGVPALCASAGGLGKSYLMLDLALRVATGSPSNVV